MQHIKFFFFLEMLFFFMVYIYVYDLEIVHFEYLKLQKFFTSRQKTEMKMGNDWHYLVLIFKKKTFYGNIINSNEIKIG